MRLGLVVSVGRLMAFVTMVSTGVVMGGQVFGGIGPIEGFGMMVSVGMLGLAVLFGWIDALIVIGLVGAVDWGGVL